VKGIVFTFDDDVVSHCTVVAPIFQEYDYSCTFFLNFNRSLNLWGGACPTMTEEQIASLYEMGFEIGNHTYCHRLATAISSEELTDSIKKVNSIIEESYRQEKPLTFCYPAYVSNSSTRDTLESLGFRLARIGYERMETGQEEKQKWHTYNRPNTWKRNQSHYYIPKKSDRFEVKCCGLFCPDYNIENFIEDISLCPKDGYCVFTGHLFHSNEEDKCFQDSVPISFLEKALRHCRDKNFDVLNLKDLPI